MDAVKYEPFERVPAFTDAVVAIAMTLLILPLLDSVSDASQKGLSGAEWLKDDGGAFVPFFISFFVIAAFWRSHNRLFDPIKHASSLLLQLNMAWMVLIVLLPVTTAATRLPGHDRTQLLPYAGGQTLASWTMIAMVLAIKARPDQLRDGASVPGSVVANAWLKAVGFTLITAMTIIVPAGGYYWFLLLFPIALATPLVAKRFSPICSPAPVSAADRPVR